VDASLTSPNGSSHAAAASASQDATFALCFESALVMAVPRELTMVESATVAFYEQLTGDDDVL
jgi:hypothetical protein